MGTPLVAAVIVVVLLLALALFARGGPAESTSLQGLPPELSGLGTLSVEELGSITGRLFAELGFSASSVQNQSTHVDLRMQDPTPVTGQSVYIRCVLPGELGAVQSHEVQSALDAARGENLTKAIVLTPGIFSNEAKLLSVAAPLELIDGQALGTLLRSHLPDVANRLGLPR